MDLYSSVGLASRMYLEEAEFTIFFIVVVRTFEVEDGDIEILVLNQGGQGGIACFGFYGRMLGVVTLEETEIFDFVFIPVQTAFII